MLTLNRSLVVLLLCTVVTGCSPIEMPQDTRTVAAATGGAIGAGLGAIIGSQTGNAGAGLAIGAAAGTGAGYLVGDGLQDSQDRARATDEMLGRRAAVIKTQRQELNSLRSMDEQGRTPALHNDPTLHNASIVNNTAPLRSAPALTPSRYFNTTNHSSAGFQNTNHQTSTAENPRTLPIHEQAERYRDQTLVVPSQRYAAAPAGFAATPARYPVAPTRSAAAPSRSALVPRSAAPTEVRVAKAVPMNAECEDGEKEFYKGRSAVQSADKLLALRRAVRLCPSDIRFQLALGQAYAGAGKSQDALFQFKQVLKLDPQNASARSSIQNLQRS